MNIKIPLDKIVPDVTFSGSIDEIKQRANDIVEFEKFLPAAGVGSGVLRQQNYFTASAGQTTFNVAYTPGLLDIYYNGARLSTSDYTANNGTYFTLATASLRLAAKLIRLNP